MGNDNPVANSSAWSGRPSPSVSSSTATRRRACRPGRRRDSRGFRRRTSGRARPTRPRKARQPAARRRPVDGEAGFQLERFQRGCGRQRARRARGRLGGRRRAPGAQQDRPRQRLIRRDAASPQCTSRNFGCLDSVAAPRVCGRKFARHGLAVAKSAGNAKHLLTAASDARRHRCCARVAAAGADTTTPTPPTPERAGIREKAAGVQVRRSRLRVQRQGPGGLVHVPQRAEVRGPGSRLHRHRGRHAPHLGPGLRRDHNEAPFKDYHLVAEWKWGDKTWDVPDPAKPGQFLRQATAAHAGILVHAVGEDGAYGGHWLESIEVQLIEGGVGDFIVVSGKKSPSLTVETRTGRRQGPLLPARRHARRASQRPHQLVGPRPQLDRHPRLPRPRRRGKPSR